MGVSGCGGWVGGSEWVCGWMGGSEWVGGWVGVWVRVWVGGVRVGVEI